MSASFGDVGHNEQWEYLKTRCTPLWTGTERHFREKLGKSSHPRRLAICKKFDSFAVFWG
jgi:hypothetical protein